MCTKIAYGFWKREAPSAPYVRHLVKKVKETKQKKKCLHQRILLLWQRMRQAPSTSINRRPQQLNISETLLR